MTLSQVSQVSRINLADNHTAAHCLDMAGGLFNQLHPKYSRGAAVAPVTYPSLWLEAHRTARKRTLRANRAGYRFEPIRRENRSHEIHAVNTSMAERQGRPMGEGYLVPTEYGPNEMTCPRHHVYTYGVLLEDTLVAYLWLYRSGELAMVSSILGHAAHLADGVMYLLWWGMLNEQAHLGGTVFYNLWNSGTDGLRFFKQRVGLTESDVEWTL